MDGILKTENRIIPAYAGQMTAYAVYHKDKWDHPRIRGTNLVGLAQGIAQSGSSPHTRDKFNSLTGKFGQNRIIPAYAGQIG